MTAETRDAVRGRCDPARPAAGRLAWVLLAVLLAPHAAAAQVDGYASALVDVFPDVAPGPGRATAFETRLRLFLERRQAIGERLRLVLSGHVDGLVGSRPGAAVPVTAATARPADLYLEWAASRVEIRVGASRLVWGRLDEFQPTDVVNPIDLSRFLLEGRTEARLSVGLARTRIFLPGDTVVEGVFVPGFRPGRFDQLDERTSPFTLTPRTALPARRDDPPFGRRTFQGGVRVTSTLGRVDVGASAFRGLRAFPTVALETQAGAPVLVESFPRFTMVGGDFETVRGPWGVRGELAAFVEDELQSTRLGRGVPGRVVEGGVGVDRRAGSYRVALNALVSRRRVDRGDPAGAALAGDGEVDRTDATLVLSADRSFVNDTRTVRVFTVYDPGNRTAFSRAIAAISLRDDVWLEASAGLFAGSSFATLGRLADRDFVYGRLKVYF